MSRKPYQSTVVPTTHKLPEKENAQEVDGVSVGQVFENTRIGALQVKSIFRHKGQKQWIVRAIGADRHMETFPLSELSAIVKGRIAYPHGCYTVGKGRIRRRKVNPKPTQRYVVLYARRPGGPLLKFVGRGKFALKGKPVRFRGGAEAQLAAWVLQDSFPVLRPYNLFWQ